MSRHPGTRKERKDRRAAKRAALKLARKRRDLTLREHGQPVERMSHRDRDREAAQLVGAARWGALGLAGCMSSLPARIAERAERAKARAARYGEVVA